jgi:Cytochrome oxidase complex assembly protein 1
MSRSHDEMRRMENTSGRKAAADVPPEVRRWNWGAFFLHWIWGIGNNTFIALLMFVPVVNLVMPFVLGAKGGEWAWRNTKWDSLEHFQRVQRLWAIWGAVSWAVVIGLFTAAFFSFAAAMKSSEAYQMGVAMVRANPEAVDALGTPIEAGIPMGTINISGPDGMASLAFSVSGPKASGTVYLEAAKSLGKWKIGRIELEVDGRRERIDLGGIGI